MTNSITVTTDSSVKAQIIEKAWTDPAFKAALMTNPKATLKESFNIEIPEGLELSVIEESSDRLVLFIPPNPIEFSSDKLITQDTW